MPPSRHAFIYCTNAGVGILGESSHITSPFLYEIFLEKFPIGLDPPYIIQIFFNIRSNSDFSEFKNILTVLDLLGQTSEKGYGVKFFLGAKAPLGLARVSE